MSFSSSRGPTGYNPGKAPSGYKTGQLQQFTPEQLKLMNKLFPYLGEEGFLSKLISGDEEEFGKLEAPALRQFSGLQGNIASRFSGMGTGGRKSSGFQNTMTAAGSNFAQELQAQRLGIKDKALEDLMKYSGMVLGQRPYENYLIKKPKKWWQTAGETFINTAAEESARNLFGGFSGGGGGRGGGDVQTAAMFMGG